MKYFTFLCFYLLLIGHSFACDICGGATNAFSTGMLPNSKHHFVGVRTSLRWFESQPAPDGHGFRGVSSQFFTSTEILGRIKLGKRFQLQAFVPYLINLKTDSITTNINGLGDAVMMGNYVFVDNMDRTELKVRQAGTIGLGVKAPTGKYFILGFEELNMLPGTGSVDFIANVNYSLQFKNFGLQHESGFSYKLANKFDYKFGNALSVTQLAYYRFDINDDVKIIPQLGLNYMHNWKDIKNGVLSEDTFNGGDMLNVQANVMFMLKSFMVNVQTYIPVCQNLNRGYVSQKSMIRIGLNYFINSKK